MYKTLFTLSLLASSVAAYAQQTNVSNTSDSTPSDIERVIVSGDFRQTTLDQLSASATILDQERLRSRQPSHIDSVLNSIPNVNFAAGASRGRFVQIRGIGERSQFAEPINPSVSFIVDEFDFSGLAAAGLIFDTKQLEVYRGPQATLYGTGALAGAVKLSSNDVGSDAPDYVEARIGNKESYRIEGATGDDINTDWGYRVALVHNRSDGFVENTFLNRSDTANIDETALRFAVEGSVDERTTLALTYRWYDIDNGYDAFSLDNDNKTLSDEPGFDEHQTHAVSARSTTNTAAGDFILIATHASHNIAYGYDEDWTFTGFHPWGYTSFDAYFRDVETQTGEMRFVSSDSAALFDGMTDWTIGVFYKSTEEKLLRQYTYLDSDFASEYTPTTTAIYAQTESRLNENLVLVAGLRVENYDFDYADNNQLTRAFDTTMVGGKVALQYTQGDHFYYGSISRGYKGAGFNPEFTGRENIYIYAAVMGLSREQASKRFDDIVAFADIGDFIEQPVKSYSSGMLVRLAFAVIAHVDADILIIDDMGKGRNSDWELGILDMLISERYNRNQIIMVTTNFTESEENTLKEQIRSRDKTETEHFISDTINRRVGERIHSRLKEMCYFENLLGRDRRIVDDELDGD